MNYEKQDIEQHNWEVQDNELTPLQILAIIIGICLLAGIVYGFLKSSGTSAIKEVVTPSPKRLTSSEIAAMLQS